MAPRHDLLFWDLGNVLVDVDPMRACLRAKGGDAQEARLLLERLIHGAHHQALETGEIAPEPFHRRLVEERLIDLDFDGFREAWVDMFEAREESFALLEAVRRQRPCWLLSNTDPLHYQAVEERWGIGRLFTGATLSFEVGARKPQRSIFHAALAAAGVAPERAGFIDDLPEHVAAARSLGIDAVQFTGADDLRVWLTDAGYDLSAT